MAILRTAPLLRQFLAVAESGTVTAAANKLSVSQPALTKSMRKLETELGVPLFDRRPRGVSLTTYGKTLLPHAQRIVAECHLADLKLTAFGSGHTGMLRIGAGLMFSATYVPSAISELYTAFPGVAFRLVSGVTETHFPQLCAGELDLMFGLMPAEETVPDHLACRPMLELTSRVIAGRSHPLVRRRSVRAKELADWPWVVVQHDRELVNHILAALMRDGGRKPRITAEVTSLSSLVRMLRSGTYLSCFAEPLAAMRDLDLLLVPYDAGIMQGEAGVVYHRSLERYGPAQALMEAVATAAKLRQV